MLCNNCAVKQQLCLDIVGSCLNRHSECNCCVTFCNAFNICCKLTNLLAVFIISCCANYILLILIKTLEIYNIRKANLSLILLQCVFSSCLSCCCSLALTVAKFCSGIGDLRLGLFSISHRYVSTKELKKHKILSLFI